MNLTKKYRPRKFEDVIGQPVVVQTICNAIKNNKLYHAYLFCGGPGSGKTSSARILAAAVNCLNSPGLYPCGSCSICKAIFSGTHTDIIEIDAASDAGSVDEIRKLKNSALYSPVDGAKIKIFIIDECHRCSPSSGDALLKLLEEPPARVMFILCTTDIQKVRPALQSRCQKHEFKKVYWSATSEYLSSISKSEKLNVDAGALNLCARLSNGSVRNGIQNLQKLIDFAGKPEITMDDAQKLFGQASEIVYFDLLDQILGVNTDKADTAEAFRIINKLLSSGVDYSTVHQSLAEQVRYLLVGLTSSKASEFITVSEEGKRRLLAQLRKCKEENKTRNIIDMLKYLNDSKRSVDLNIPPETALQQWVVDCILSYRS